MSANLIGPNGQMYGELLPGVDETQFRVDNTSSAYYKSPYFLAHRDQVQRIPPRRPNVLPFLNVADFLPPEVMTAIQKAGKIAFHAVGDTGAAKVGRAQTAQPAIEHEAAVADAMSADVQNQGLDGSAFFFHLGDVIYNFGEAQYYYDQFYEPFRVYDRPIFAVAGNHDGMVFGQGSSAPQVPTLDAFLANFCAPAPGLSPDAGGLMRSVMTQPGVYFTVDAPFVSIIGIYSNVLEGPGVISSQRGHFPIVDDQLDFLKSELTRLKPMRQARERAVVIAVHHPPLSADVKHAGSRGLEKDLDACCKAAGLWPDVVLSGHAHLYQRFTRTVAGKETPYIVSGSGGFSATPAQHKLAPAPITIGDYKLEIDPIVEFGYLTIETDAQTISITFKTATRSGVAIRDAVSVDLKAGKLLVGAPVVQGTPTPDRKPPRRKPKPRRKPIKAKRKPGRRR